MKLTKKIPWAELEQHYAQTSIDEASNVGNSARLAKRAIMIINARYGFSDEDTVREIRINPYLRFFFSI